MKKFKDIKGRDWSVSITVDSIKRVKSELDCDLLKVVEGSLIEEFISNPILLCDVLFVLCEEQAKSGGVSDRDFGSALDGDVIENATSILLDELVCFFPKAKRQVLTKALGKIREMETKAMQAVSDQMDSPQFQEKLNQKLLNAIA